MIEYCLHNVDHESRTRLHETGDRTVERACMQRCGECWRNAFLVVDGECRYGDSHDALLARIDVD